MRRAIVFAVAVAAASAALIEAQVRDGGLAGSALAPSGTAVLTGILTTDTSPPQPVRRATMRLSDASRPGVRLTGTDDNGRFTFDALPAGTFTLSATRPGFVETFYGSTRPGRGPGVPIAIADGQRVEVSARLIAGAVVTGTITDPRGAPAVGVDVGVVNLRTARVVHVTTDDRGMYRAFGLVPGEYAIAARPQVGANANGRGQTASEIVAVTDAEAQWARAGAASRGIPMPAPGHTVNYAPIYYPGTTDATAAAPVTVAAGEERGAVGFVLQAVPTARIAGAILDGNGQPTSAATIALTPRRHDTRNGVGPQVLDALVVPRYAAISPSGFSFDGVAPGDYTIVARSGTMTRGAANAAPAGVPPLWCIADLTVDGRDQTGLVLRLAPGVKVSGTIAFDRRGGSPAPDAAAIELSLQAIGTYASVASSARARVAPDGTFAFASVVPWTYTLTATLPAGDARTRWTLKSAALTGRELADGPFAVQPGADIAGVTVTFTDRAASIAGRVVDAGGRPVTRYAIAVFPTSRADWRPGSRRIRLASPATDGSFAIDGLPAGDYAIAAVADVEAADLDDAAFLTQLLAAAYKVTLADGEQKRQDLRAGR